MVAQPKKLWIVLAFAAVYLIWGSTYLGIRFAIATIPPFLMAGSRFFIAGLIMLGIARTQGPLRSTWRDWRTSFVVGVCLLLGGNGGVTLSEKYIDSGLAAVIVAMVPIYIALLSWLTRMSPRPSPIVWLGLCGGLSGVTILLGPELRFPATESKAAVTGISILLASSFIWSAGSLYSRAANHGGSAFLAVAQQMICGGGLMLAAGVLFERPSEFDLNKISALSLGAFIYLVLIGAIVGYTAYVFLLRHCDPAKVATYAYVNPVVAVLLGTTFAGELLTLRMIFGAGLIIASVALVIMAQKIKAKQGVPIRETADCVR